MVVGSDQLVSHWLLLRRQASIERLEHSKEASVVVDAHLRELLAQLEALDRVHVTAILPCGSNRLVECLSVLAHSRAIATSSAQSRLNPSATRLVARISIKPAATDSVNSG